MISILFELNLTEIFLKCTILGPLLFLILMNDLFEGLSSHSTLFVYFNLLDYLLQILWKLGLDIIVEYEL